MKTNRPIWFTAAVLCSIWVALTDNGASAGDKASAKDKIKALQKQRLEVAIKARDYFVKNLPGHPVENPDTITFALRLIDSNMLVLRARLDLCEKKGERITAIEECIKVIEPKVAIYEKRFKAGARAAEPAFYLMQAHLLELQIALGKTKLETIN